MLRYLFILSAALFVQGAAAQARQTDSPPLWKVGKSLYIFGSFHLLPDHVTWRTPAVDRALKEAEVVVLETDVGGMNDAEAMKPLFVKYGLMPPGQTLPGILPPKVNADLEKTAAQLGMPVAALAPMRPWLAMLILTVQFLVSQGFDPNKGIEQQVLAWAKQNNRRLESLESVESQLRIFSDLPREEEIALLATSLQQIHEMPGMLNQLLAAYRKGDAATLDRILNAAMNEHPSLRKRVIGDRHREWLPKLEAMVAGGKPTLVIVGAAHTVGADGLAAMLRAKGHKVEGP
jgi:uncharacterized protein YbaP (TraB family)